MIPKDTTIMIPTVGLHMDERFWDEPEKFDPERFNEENVKKIVPYSYIPFGEGPRYFFFTFCDKILNLFFLIEFALVNVSAPCKPNSAL
jgi:hypothetical protein